MHEPFEDIQGLPFICWDLATLMLQSAKIKLDLVHLVLMYNSIKQHNTKSISCESMYTWTNKISNSRAPNDVDFNLGASSVPISLRTTSGQANTVNNKHYNPIIASLCVNCLT